MIQNQICYVIGTASLENVGTKRSYNIVVIHIVISIAFLRQSEINMLSRKKIDFGKK